jgi:hypothetical protein
VSHLELQAHLTLAQPEHIPHLAQPTGIGFSLLRGSDSGHESTVIRITGQRNPSKELLTV